MISKEEAANVCISCRYWDLRQWWCNTK